MSEWFEILMLVTGGLFAGGVLLIAWERIPAWRESELSDFRGAFAHTLRRVDRLQPLLLVLALASTIGFAIAAGGGGRAVAVVAAAGFLVILVGSGAWLVPLQRRLVASRERPSAELERWRRQWFRGHMIRTVVALVSLALAVVAAVS
jgi:Domain of unknown function (DUF1772)